jgi:uroporphyrinogen III methyltransferase/synthase
VTATESAAPALAGRCIAVTRSRAQAPELASLLEAHGARVLAAPTIAIEPPASWTPLDAALGALERYDWVVFTSVNGVEMARSRVPGAGPWLARRRIAAIGPATARALREWGCPAELVPTEFVAEALARELAPRVGAGTRVLVARAAEARDVLVRELRARGAQVDEVPAYRTRPSDEGGAALRAALEAGRVDAVTFTSSSTVRHCAALFAPGEAARALRGVVVACIGPITRETARAHGLQTQIMPAEYTIPALADAIVAHFRQRS